MVYEDSSSMAVYYLVNLLQILNLGIKFFENNTYNRLNNVYTIYCMTYVLNHNIFNVSYQYECREIDLFIFA